MRRVPIRRLDTSETYIEVFVAILETPMNGQAASVDEMRAVVPLLNLLRSFDVEADDYTSILLEESHWQMLCERLRLFRGFGRNGQDLLQMVDDVMGAPEVTEVPVMAAQEMAEPPAENVG